MFRMTMTATIATTSLTVSSTPSGLIRALIPCTSVPRPAKCTGLSGGKWTDATAADSAVPGLEMKKGRSPQLALPAQIGTGDEADLAVSAPYFHRLEVDVLTRVTKGRAIVGGLKALAVNEMPACELV